MDAKELFAEARKRKAEDREKVAIKRLKYPSKRRVKIGDVAQEGCGYRYGSASHLKKIPFTTFVPLLDRLSRQTLKQYHREGIPQAVLSELKGRKLDGSWRKIHEKLEEVSQEWAFLFMSGMCNPLREPLSEERTNFK
jgi:hypothetical protein